MRAILVLLLGAIPTIALAQTTNCFRTGDTVQCTTSGSPGGFETTPFASQIAPPPQINYGLMGLAIAARQQRQQEQALEQQEAYERALQIGANDVAALIRQGKCEAAKQYALDFNDLNLAAQVVALCPMPAQAAAPVAPAP